MYNFNQHLHFIGIGGVGMAGIAEVLLNLGYSVSGSDLKQSPLTDNLEELGARICIGHHESNVDDSTDVVVVSSAVPEDNPELLKAIGRNIPVIPRAEMLAELMRMKYGVAVAGSHGKTTTTSMTAKILSEIGLDPTVIIGGRVLSEESGASLGTGQYLVAEADESDGSFCLLRPAIAVVTNIDTEHLSHYGSFGALEQAFESFMGSVPFYGLVVACADDPVVSRLLGRLKRRVLTYGMSPEHDIWASDIKLDGPVSSYTLHVHGREVGRTTLPMSGIHMVSNSLAAIAVSVELGAYPEEACRVLEEFPGVARRTERIGEHNGILVVDDYGHHPSEIAATIRALRSGWIPFQMKQAGVSEPGRLIVLFQPHRYSRTKELFAEFLTAFDEADQVLVSDIYPAGENEIPGVHAESLAASLQHPQVSYFPDLKDSLPSLVPTLKPGDIVLTLGAGTIGRLARRVSQVLKER